MPSGLGQAIGPVGIVTDMLLKASLERATAHVGNRVNRNLFLPPGDACRLYQQGLISQVAFQEIMDAAGAYIAGAQNRYPYVNSFENGVVHIAGRVDPALTMWDAVLWSTAWVPGITQCYDLFFRGLISPAVMEHFLTLNGVASASHRSMLDNAMLYVPPVSDILQFSTRQIFNPVLRRKYGLDDEFAANPDMPLWLAAAGLRETYIVDANGKQIKRDFARDYWANHWSHPGPAQLYAFVQRLRPNRIQHWQGIVPGVQPFTQDDISEALRLVNYAPYWRKQLTALSYRLPSRIDIRRLLSNGVIDAAEAVEQFQDIGYGKPTAEQLTKLAQLSGFKKPGVGLLTKWLRRGVINNAEFNAALTDLGYRDAHRGLIFATLSANVPLATALRLYRKGLIDRQQASTYLDWNGITEPLRKTLLDEPHAQLSVGQLLRMYIRGILKTGETRLRLVALGYSAADAKLLMDDAQAGNATKLTRLTRGVIREAYITGGLTRDEATGQLVLIGLTPEEIGQFFMLIETELHTQFAKQTLSTLRSLLLSGRMDEAAVVNRMTALRMTQDQIGRYLSFWRLQMQRRSKELSGQKVIDLLKRGLINVNEAQRRLNNLGYGFADAQLLIAAGEQDAQQAAAKAAARAARTIPEQQNAARRLLKQQAAQNKQAMADLARHGSASQLATWWAKGLVSEKIARRRLTALGWPSVDQTRLLEEARGKYGKKPADKLRTPPLSTDQPPPPPG